MSFVAEKDPGLIPQVLSKILDSCINGVTLADPDIEDMVTPYQKALAKLIPVFMPDILFRLDRKGQPLFPDVAAKVKPTEFEPGKKFGTGTMEAIDYLVALADGVIEPPSNLNIRTVQQQQESNAFRYHLVQYMTRRAAEWKRRGFTETVIDFPTLNAIAQVTRAMCDRLGLNVFGGNAAAIRLYDDLGYGVDAQQMSKRI